MRALYSVSLSLLAVVMLVVVALVGVRAAAGRWLFGVILPYLAFATFVVGMIWRVVVWGRAPVPFRIPTTGGQQKSLPWVKNSNLESPHNLLGVVGRMALEVLFFRSLLRNTKAEVREGPRMVYRSEKLLWSAGLAFHWALLVVVVRHLAFFLDPVPGPVAAVGALDSFFRTGTPTLYMTDAVLLAAVTFLFLRRILDSQLRYFSLPADYFPLFLILGIAASGVLMRCFVRVDLEKVKELALGLATFRPILPAEIGVLFYVHLFLVSFLLAYFPFSKLTHLGGVFLNPTRNLANDSRARRHINPWDYPVIVHTYQEYEDEFRDKMKAAGLPLEKE